MQLSSITMIIGSRNDQLLYKKNTGSYEQG